MRGMRSQKGGPLWENRSTAFVICFGVRGSDFLSGIIYLHFSAC